MSYYTNILKTHRTYMYATPLGYHTMQEIGDGEAVSTLADIMCASFPPGETGRIYYDGELLYTYTVPES